MQACGSVTRHSQKKIATKCAQTLRHQTQFCEVASYAANTAATGTTCKVLRQSPFATAQILRITLNHCATMHHALLPLFTFCSTVAIGMKRCLPLPFHFERA